MLVDQRNFVFDCLRHRQWGIVTNRYW